MVAMNRDAAQMIRGYHRSIPLATASDAIGFFKATSIQIELLCKQHDRDMQRQAAQTTPSSNQPTNKKRKRG